jgi:dipeptidyl aminopeptidase/acylaminoacyl peptidase
MSPFVERQVAFESGGLRLYGFLTAPAEASSCPAVLLLDGFGGGGHGPRGMYARAARALAAAGVASLRFGFRAHGDSEGEFRDVTIEGELDDAHRALGYLIAQPGVDASRLGLVGLSLGGLVAAYIAVAQPAVRALALWCAVAHGRGPWVTETLREQEGQLRAVGYADGGGYALSSAFLEQLRASDPVRALSRYSGRALIVHGTEDANVPLEHAYRYREALGERAELVLVEGADHVFSGLHWERTVIEATVGFLESAMHFRGPPVMT